MISLPDRDLFISIEHYYATKFHEIGHSTGHPSRLNRIVIQTYKHDKYSKEDFRCGEQGHNYHNYPISNKKAPQVAHILSPHDHDDAKRTSQLCYV